MLNWKSAKAATAAGVRRKSLPVHDEAGAKPWQAANSAALELEADPGAGCDPYNRTGQHLVEAIRSLKER